VAGHKKQIRAHADNAWNAQAENFLAINCGDYNEQFSPGDGTVSYVEEIMASRHMHSARPKAAKNDSLDGAFISQGVEVVSFDWIPKHLLTTDHDGFLLVVDI
jgi:hypothetical protein